jgi:hypothetical protein
LGLQLLDAASSTLPAAKTAIAQSLISRDAPSQADTANAIKLLLQVQKIIASQTLLDSESILGDTNFVAISLLTY